MKQSNAAGRLATFRLLVQRFAFLSLIVASVALMILGKADIILIERTRALVADALAPVLDAMARPAATVAQVTQNFHELTNLRTENARLREENTRLMHWQTVARRLESENVVLHENLNVIPEPDPAFVTTRVIGDMGSAFGHSMLLGAGSKDGVRKGQAVMSGEVLVGHVAEVGLRSSRMLLITDINARTPILVESTRTRAILSGDNTARPRMTYVAGSPNMAVGDRIVTAASGGAFPPGIPIGVISSINDGVTRVEPFIQRHHLEFVSVVDFGLGGIIPFDRPPPPERRRRGKEKEE
ncbi:rod shape-determining protein MreC [Paramagnetospirillum kuznetsovii]|uniref:Cell shape-determining protein MreC n=1 Tax=Paramagnetospirillum kuznetsovii TaxID=2053833 RepID=A0A364NZG6_9PROT|nr:rod shape-determining protein MreC [Paramagnetospirillum kuznetsovii]RAU22285.1 rod shape-determining protein MreC [Paramagnetospirillum kuznetsovii]